MTGYTTDNCLEQAICCERSGVTERIRRIQYCAIHIWSGATATTYCGWLSCKPSKYQSVSQINYQQPTDICRDTQQSGTSDMLIGYGDAAYCLL